MSVDIIEAGDLVEFTAPGKWTPVVESEGIVIAVYKNGSMKVRSDDGVYKVKAGDATVLAKEYA